MAAHFENSGGCKRLPLVTYRPVPDWRKSVRVALCYGDNLDVLRRQVADESVDLVYLDPPLKSD
jgi:16S rRNA G966 N2-methylase RsmD